MATELHLDAIVLAAGFGRRFGGGKLTHPYGGGLLIDGAFAAARAAPARTVTVITGADPAVEAVARAAGFRTAHAPDHADGLSASLKAGLAALPGDCDGVFIFLGDMPNVPVDVPPRLANALGGGILAAQPVHNGQRGHPALIARALFPSIMTLTGDAGAGVLLKSLGDRVALVDAGPGVLFDVDTPSAEIHDFNK